MFVLPQQQNLGRIFGTSKMHLSSHPPWLRLLAVHSKVVALLLLTCFFFIVTPIVGFCNCSMFMCTLLYVPFSFAIILMRKRERELVAMLSLSSLCLVVVV